MNGVHDLGGMHGFGPINPQADEPVFHHEWERRMFGMMIAILCGGHFGVDEFRQGVERLSPAEYLGTSYYEHWLRTMEMLLQEHGVITAQELAAARAKLGASAQ
jgi:nitrile hydratase